MKKTVLANPHGNFQLLNDGNRWWLLTIYLQAETPEHPLPKKYLKSHN